MFLTYRIFLLYKLLFLSIIIVDMIIINTFNFSRSFYKIVIHLTLIFVVNCANLFKKFHKIGNNQQTKQKNILFSIWIWFSYLKYIWRKK